MEEVYHKTFSSDVYFASSNAITENGELYNVDGNSNRVAAILYGPKSVILVCGYNKIVKNIDEAIDRVKRIAAPGNTIRLDLTLMPLAQSSESAFLPIKKMPNFARAVKVTEEFAVTM